MNYRTRLKQWLIATLVVWLMTGMLIGFMTYNLVSLTYLLLMMAALAISVLVSVATLNHTQNEVSRINKAHSRTKRAVQEQQLKIDRFEYEAKKAGELRRIVLNSTQEKDHSLRSMADALHNAMDEIMGLLQEQPDNALEQMQSRTASMKRYAGDLQYLARLELKSELPEYVELDFLSEISRLIDDWSGIGKPRKVKVKLDNHEEQLVLHSDAHWLENLLSRIVHPFIRLNEKTQLVIHLICYLDAELGDALRIEFSIDGWQFADEQLKRLLTEYVSVVQDGQEIGPGLSFVVARRMAQMLNGYLDVANSGTGLQALVVLPRNSLFDDEAEELGAY
ncbi:MAG: hypothetical protein P8X74_15305 [Reinekea sp.]